MKNIDLTSPNASLAYLRSFPACQMIELPGYGDLKPATGAVTALEVITGMEANIWATGYNRWEWTIGEILKELGPRPGDRVAVTDLDGAQGTIERIDDDGDFHLVMEDQRRLCRAPSCIELASTSAAQLDSPA